MFNPTNVSLYYRKKDAPCKGCNERTSICHSYCKDYAEWSKYDKARNKAILDAKAKDDMITETAVVRSRKIKEGYVKK